MYIASCWYIKHELKQRFCISDMLTVNYLILLAFILAFKLFWCVLSIKSIKKNKKMFSDSFFFLVATLLDAFYNPLWLHTWIILYYFFKHKYFIIPIVFIRMYIHLLSLMTLQEICISIIPSTLSKYYKFPQLQVMYIYYNSPSSCWVPLCRLYAPFYGLYNIKRYALYYHG